MAAIKSDQKREKGANPRSDRGSELDRSAIEAVKNGGSDGGESEEEEGRGEERENKGFVMRVVMKKRVKKNWGMRGIEIETKKGDDAIRGRRSEGVKESREDRKREGERKKEENREG